MNGKHIKCSRCDGHGLRTVWSFGVKEPDECPDCGGSGNVWRYESGVIAKWYGGPLLGRDPAAKPALLESMGNVAEGLERSLIEKQEAADLAEWDRIDW